MKNYAEMSDFEINKAAAIALGIDVRGSTEENNAMYGYVTDYCNSWSDAGPIIIDNCIVLTPCMAKNNGDATGYFAHKNPIEIEFDENSKALRSAMIVFLMMKDAEE